MASVDYVSNSVSLGNSIVLYRKIESCILCCLRFQYFQAMNLFICRCYFMNQYSHCLFQVRTAALVVFCGVFLGEIVRSDTLKHTLRNLFPEQSCEGYWA
eukprot:m.211008 g.211008  ORF g.211008 m.211008 type:complete len:100 (-) comp19023_c0_seq8:501-800(-)